MTMTMTLPQTARMIHERPSQFITERDEGNSTNVPDQLPQQQPVHQWPQPATSTGRLTHTALGAIAVNWK